MKKIITIIVAIAMIAFVLTGCGTSAETGKDIGLKKPSDGTFKTEEPADATKAAVSKSVTDKAVDTTTEEPAVTAEPTVEEANADIADTNAEVAANTEAAQSAPATQSNNKTPASNGNTNTKQPSTPVQNNTPAQQAQPVKTPAPTPAPHQHSYTATITANATCSNAGVKTYTCSCGNSYTESIPATGAHNWVNHTVTKSVKNTKVPDLYTRDWSPSDLKWNAGLDVPVTKLTHCACGKYFLGDSAFLHSAMMADDTTCLHNQSSCDPSIDNPSGYYYIECGSTTITEVDYVYCSVCGVHQ